MAYRQFLSCEHAKRVSAAHMPGTSIDMLNMVTSFISNMPAVVCVVEVVEYSCNLAPDLMGEYIEGVSTGMDTYSIKQPLGVCPLCERFVQRLLPACCQHSCLQLS